MKEYRYDFIESFLFEVLIICDSAGVSKPCNGVAGSLELKKEGGYARGGGA